jgi:hypothetical protein
MTRVNPVHDDMNQSQIRPASANTPDEKTRLAATRGAAARTVADHAVDAVDCALLLDALGLRPGEGKRGQ